MTIEERWRLQNFLSNFGQKISISSLWSLGEVYWIFRRGPNEVNEIYRLESHVEAYLKIPIENIINTPIQPRLLQKMLTKTKRRLSIYIQESQLRLIITASCQDNKILYNKWN